MSDPSTVDDPSPGGGWRAVSPETVAPPLVRECPYLELKLEHPELEAVGYADRFFPDAVPYEYGGTSRVWYWRPALTPSSSDPGGWGLVCATTHGLSGVGALPASVPALLTGDADGTTVVVDGTVGGDVRTSRVRSYAAPEVSVVRRTRTGVELKADEDTYTIERGERRRIRLSERRVVPADGDGGPTTVAPELLVRYPGRRELHHPAARAAYRLFPSFGLRLSDVPNPVSVPTAAGELDDAALAAELGVDLSARPYPERVLWQAFAYAAFDPHADAHPELTQLETGHLVLRKGVRERRGRT